MASTGEVSRDTIESQPSFSKLLAEQHITNGGEEHKKPEHSRKASLSDLPGFSRQDSTNPLRKGLPRRIQSLSKLLDQFVLDMGGDRPIYSVLVANNGLAAVKFMRSIRSWATHALGSSKAVSLVAMATPNDIRINAEHVQLSDQFVEVPGGSNNNNYANVSLIVRVAERAGVDAVWPGWGHASENPDLPAALAERNIRFLGPDSVAMAALGDKIGSTILAQAAGVPTLPWSGTGVAISFGDCNGIIPEEIYKQACIHSVEEALESCQRIGYPIMLKASWGGGGKGIRKVHNDEEVKALFKQVQGEVPGSPIFAMKLAPISRHLEVQLLCDMHGNVASLMSRDCSIQRRHQKIVEEGPVTAAPPEMLRAMEARARALARSVGYVGAATVEYLYCIEERQYCFLELNPRLQVEHPVTEGITGVNIPAAQLQIGMGIPLYRIPAVRALYCQDPRGAEPFDLETTPQKLPDCHVVAVRITAEDANDGFKPTCGRIDELHFRPTPEVWAYFSVKSGGGIHEYSDSQFGHLFAKGETRGEALRHMVVALRELAIRGEVRTIVDYALDMIQSPDLTANVIHTGWLDARIALKVQAGRPPWHLSVIAGAVVKAYEHISSQSVEYLGYLAKGQLPPASVSLTHFNDALVIDGARYAVRVARSGPTAFIVTLNGSRAEVCTRKMVNGGFLLQVDGENHVVYVEEEAMGTRLMIDSLTCLLAKEADPSCLRVASPCKLVRHLVPSGSALQRDQPYAEVEVMKMMMPLLSPAEGVITFLLPEGSALAAGDRIADLELKDPAAVVKAEPFNGVFPELGAPVIPSARLDQRFKGALDGCKMVLDGYVHDLDELVPELVSCLDSPALALLQWEEEMAVIYSRLPGELAAALEGLIAPHVAEVEAHEAVAAAGLLLPLAGAGPGVGGEAMAHPFPARALLQRMQAALDAVDGADLAPLQAMLAPLQAVAEQHQAGKEEFARSVVQKLFEQLLAVEEAFKPNPATGAVTEQEVIDGLRKVHSGHLQAVLDMVVSHQGLPLKAKLALRLLSALVLPDPAPYRPYLRRFAQLRGRGTAELSVRAQNLLEQSLMADLRVVVARALSGLDMFRRLPTTGASDSGGPVADAARLNADLTSSPLGSPRVSPPGPPPPAPAAYPPGLATGFGSAFAAAFTEGEMAVAEPTAATPPPALPSASGSPVARTTTAAEGLYIGLTSTRGTPSDRTSPLNLSRAATWQIEAKMDLLVTAQAAVDDALASLLVDRSDSEIQARAASTYIRRLYHPYLVRDPMLRLHLPPRPDVILTAVWLYTEPVTADSAEPRTCVGALVLLERLAGLQAGLELVGAELRGFGLGTLPLALHVAVAGDEVALQAAEAAPSAAAAQVLLDDGCSLVSRSELGTDEEPLTSARAAEAALGGAVARCLPALLELNVGSVNLLCQRTDSGLLLRAGFGWDAGRKVYLRDRFARQAETITATLMELPKLRQYKELQYTPSRNRQWHMYTGVERPDVRSYPLRRLYVRGTVRQFGHPALLAASYSGNISAVAAAAVHEIEEGLVGCLEELTRLQASSSSSTLDASSDSLSGRPDWTHIFISVLPPMPTLHSSPSFSSPSAFFPEGSLAGGGGAAAAAARDAGVAAALRAAAAALVAKHMGAFRRAAVAQLEIRLRDSQSDPAWRLVVLLPTGHEHGEEHVEVYRELLPPGPNPFTSPVGHSPLTPAPPSLIFRAHASHTIQGSASIARSEAAAAALPGPGAAASGSLHGCAVLGPYPALEPLQQRRLAARRHAVTYCYDFPSVFEDALRDIWAARAAAGEPCSAPPASRLVEVEELVLAGGGARAASNFKEAARLQRSTRAIGNNECGMVAWLATLKTPECPQGRQIVMIANDITFQSGAFSPREDTLFRAATELSLDQRLPLVYLAANSGARVGLAAEVRSRLQVQWTDPADPSKGFDYLYLSAGDYAELLALERSGGAKVLRAEPRAAPGGGGEVHWVLRDVIGQEDGIGVECLSGSGAIAAAYARAFREGYTVTLVSGRTVGIGAYLARLGRRCVQRADQPVILTGYSALNKLLGRQVYTSQMQLGGPRVMGFNGVSHHVVRDDLEGAATVLKLLAFVPATLAGEPPLLPSADPENRLIGYAPAAGEKLDPRAAIAGTPPGPAPGGAAWHSGMFDHNTWVESHSSWACTVVTGRARLGGLPVGVIAVETQMVMRQQPADPGMPESSEQTIPQAGQVWYPDSAQKTALAMEEFGLEGLPLFVLANWRGFSGGQRDLFEGVLQAGSLIVEQLRSFQQPVFVYIPCTAELRGGAWVVVDSQINAACVEMYADPGARGGVLEPEGVVEIKFRRPDLLRMMHRIDPVMASLRRDGGGGEAAVKEREKALLPIYNQVARAFADMHDTPVRMLAKGVIRSIVPWAHARRFFAARLRRRLAEETLAKHVMSTDSAVARSAALAVVRGWYAQAASSQAWLQPMSPDSSGAGASTAVAEPAAAAAVGDGGVSVFEAQTRDDVAFLRWAESSGGRAHVAQELRGLRTRSAKRIVTHVLGTLEGKEGLLKSLQAAARKDAVLAMQLRMMLNEVAAGGGPAATAAAAGSGLSSAEPTLNVSSEGGARPALRIHLP